MKEQSFGVFDYSNGSWDGGLLVGCPIKNREWCLSEWWFHVEKSAGLLEPAYLFVCDPDEQPLYDLIHELAETYKSKLFIVAVDDAVEYTRNWNHERYHEMVWLRNCLLDAVREIGPDLFLSLDSDILLHPDAIGSMVSKMGEKGFDAIGGKCFLEPSGLHSPNYGMMKRNKDSFTRTNAEGLIAVDILMAIKLMSSNAYSIDYTWNKSGEDIGWSLECKAAGLKLGWDGTVVNKHLMSREALNKVDVRAGF